MLAAAQCELKVRDWRQGEVIVQDARARPVLHGIPLDGTSFVRLVPGKPSNFTQVTNDGTVIGFLNSAQTISLQVTKPTVVTRGVALIMPGAKFEAPAGGPWTLPVPKTMHASDGSSIVMPALPCTSLALEPMPEKPAVVSQEERFVGVFKDVGLLFAEGKTTPVEVSPTAGAKAVLRLDPTAPTPVKIKERKKGWVRIELWRESVTVMGWVPEADVQKIDAFGAFPEGGSGGRGALPIHRGWSCTRAVKVRAFGEPIVELAPDKPAQLGAPDAGMTPITLFDFWAKPVDGVQLELNESDAKCR